jgi:membrane-bound lytic murein transglycosylase D
MHFAENKHLKNYMKKTLFLLLYSLFFVAPSFAQSFMDTFESDLLEAEKPNSSKDSNINEEEIDMRLGYMNSCVKIENTDEVKKFIKARLRSRSFTQELLGRLLTYNELIDKFLLENGLPEDLQYIAVVESALSPKCVSHAGASGLWQLMPINGKEHNLVMNSSVDERFDTYKSTQAAMKELRNMYAMYNDWALALAAYNAGSGNVNKALKKAHGSTNYWAIRKYLPRETQHYVPAFIATSYVMQFYVWHNMKPKLPSLDVLMTASTTVKQDLSFALISQATGIPVETIQELNPAYVGNAIPYNPKGHILILPKRVMATFEYFLEHISTEMYEVSSRPIIFTAQDKEEVRKNYTKSSIFVNEGDNLVKVGQLFGANPHLLKAWNGLAYFHIMKSQELAAYFPKNDLTAQQTITAASTENNLEKQVYPPVVSSDTIAVATIPEPKVEENTTTIAPTIFTIALQKISPSSPDEQGKFTYHYIAKNETFADIGEQYNVPISDILYMNTIPNGQIPSFGTKIKVKRL